MGPSHPCAPNLISGVLPSGKVVPPRVKSPGMAGSGRQNFPSPEPELCCLEAYVVWVNQGLCTQDVCPCPQQSQSSSTAQVSPLLGLLSFLFFFVPYLTVLKGSFQVGSGTPWGMPGIEPRLACARQAPSPLCSGPSCLFNLAVLGSVRINCVSHLQDTCSPLARPQPTSCTDGEGRDSCWEPVSLHQDPRGLLLQPK